MLAALRDYRCKASEETVRQALVGNDCEEHVVGLAQALGLYDTYQAKSQSTSPRASASACSAIRTRSQIPAARQR